LDKVAIEIRKVGTIRSAYLLKYVYKGSVHVKRIAISIASISISILFFVNEVAYAKNTFPSFEDNFAEMGYKSVEESVKEFENHCKCDVKLPEIMPSMTFTHKFGRFYEEKGNNSNDALRIMFVNKDLRENIYKIEIRPVKHKLDFEDNLSFKGSEYTLQDGSRAIYFESHQFSFFVFEKNNIQYLLGIHIKVSNTETPDTFVRIANSVK
jgi:hypothetical protein